MIEYEALNKPVLDKVPVSANKILDVGCGTGVMGMTLKTQKSGRLVYGLTYSEKEYESAKQFLDRVIIADLNNGLPETDVQFDCILFSHILEHTYQPQRVLETCADFLSEDGTIIIALPNVLHYRQRWKFMTGKFQYSESGGVMDITHFRFFDWVTAQNLITNAGFKITCKEAVGNFPLPLLRKLVPSFCTALDRLSLKYWPGMFGFQFVFIAKK